MFPIKAALTPSTAIASTMTMTTQVRRQFLMDAGERRLKHRPMPRLLTTWTYLLAMTPYGSPRGGDMFGLYILDEPYVLDSVDLEAFVYVIEFGSPKLSKWIAWGRAPSTGSGQL